MILVTCGTQLPFPRLVSAMDLLADSLDEEVIIQTGASDLHLQNAQRVAALAPADFDQLAQRARLIVAHAGIGSLLDAARFHLPLIIVPRRFELGEHRNDHQMATARRLVGRFAGLAIAWDIDVLPGLIAKASEPVVQVDKAPLRLVRALAAELHDPFALNRSFLACLFRRPVRRTESPSQQQSAAARL